jgi:hypothetical protein
VFAGVSEMHTSAAKIVKPTRAMRIGPAKLTAKLVVSSSANTLQAQ